MAWILGLLIVSRPPAMPAQPSADDARRQAEAAERDRAAALEAEQAARARAVAAAAEAARLTDQRAIAAARLREAQANTDAAAARMQELARERRDSEAALAKDAAALMPLLPLMQRLALYPAETMLAVPEPPEDAIRGLLVIQGVARGLEGEAAKLREDQAVAETARRALATEAPKLAAAEAAQAAAQSELDRQIAGAIEDRQDAERDAEAEAARAAELAARAETLRALVERLEAERRAAAERAAADATRAERQHRAAAAARARARQEALSGPASKDSLASADRPAGQLVMPAAGGIVRGWGAPTEAGPATGITYGVPPAARVAAPCSGRVAFAAPFRSYGQLLILDCGGDYKAVLSGFERLDAKLGQLVRKGDPVGVMPGGGGEAGKRAALYVELRRRGVPVDPSPWIKGGG